MLLPELQQIACALDGYPDLRLSGNTERALHFGSNVSDLALQSTIGIAEMCAIGLD